ncbi:cAMP-binding protein [Clostridiales bacterium PH28_bin88]|nr:cAMP-binding protein [Clostridiales bacterium PH28_bin88]
MQNELIGYLRQVPVFQGLTEDELLEMARIVIVRRYKKNMIIFVEGEPGDGLYLVKKGKVKLSKLLEDGREKILHFLQDGDIFAEVLLFDRGPFPATAEAMEDAEIGIIRQADIEDFLRRNPGITLKILKVMSRRLRQAQLHVRDLAYMDVYARLAVTLWQLAEDHGRDTEHGRLIDIPLSQQELANLVGASRETVARIISEWKRAGVLQISRQRITVVKPEKLRRWV